MITGKGRVIAHIGYPTTSFKAPMVYNPWFETNGIDAIVVPFGLKAESFSALFRPLFQAVTTLHGALITMPHKVAVTKLVDELSTTARIAGSANAVLKRPDGTLLGDMFDGTGFVRGMQRKGRQVEGARALVVGAGRGGICHRRVACRCRPGRNDAVRSGHRVRRGAGRTAAHPLPAARCADRLTRPSRPRHRGERHPMGMNDGDALPWTSTGWSGTFVGEVVMKEDYTPCCAPPGTRGARSRSAPTCCSR